jgi:phosphoglycolate phosphatase
VEDFKRRYRRRPVISTAPFPHVLDMLRGPLKGTPKAIVTNKPQDITLEILGTLRMTEDFASVIGMHAGFPAKPDPSSVREMMGRFHATPSETVYVGDSNVDAETSENAGIDFAWVDYGYDMLQGRKAAHHFSSATEWQALLKGGC